MDCDACAVLTNDDARGLALVVPLEWSDSDRELIAPLVDAVLVWADEDELARIAGPIIATLWSDDLREDIENALEEVGERNSRIGAMLPVARADLDTGPHHSRLARAVVEQAAAELAFEEQQPVCCILCLEEALAAAPPAERRRLSARLARIASRPAGVRTAEIRAAVAVAAVAGAEGDVALALATDERRLAVRVWLRRLGELGVRSVPTISTELLAALDGPLPPASHDEIWRETVRGLTETLEPEWN